MNIFKHLLRKAIIFIICGTAYISVELLFRQHSHISMFILAGICGVFFIDSLNNIYTFELGYLRQVGISTLVCTVSEGICGIVVNDMMHLNVWDYSNLCGIFFMGQCNIFFVIVWALLIGLIGIPLCDSINYYWFHIEPCPYYKINGKVFLSFKERAKNE